MRFNFHYTNDFGDRPNCCVRCQNPDKPTYERFVLDCSGVRLTVWVCRSCLADLANPFWMLHEFMIRALYKARDCQDAGEAVEYDNSFNFDWSGNGQPLTKHNKTKQARPKRADSPARRFL